MPCPCILPIRLNLYTYCARPGRGDRIHAVQTEHKFSVNAKLNRLFNWVWSCVNNFMEFLSHYVCAMMSLNDSQHNLCHFDFIIFADLTQWVSALINMRIGQLSKSHNRLHRKLLILHNHSNNLHRTFISQPKIQNLQTIWSMSKWFHLSGHTLKFVPQNQKSEIIQQCYIAKLTTAQDGSCTQKLWVVTYDFKKD